jgi:Putative heavy-metal-binding
MEMEVQTSTNNEIDGGQIGAAIGRIEAASTWHAANSNDRAESWREHALRNLIRRAEDIDADAIIGLAFEVEGDVSMPETGVALARIRAKGIAVKVFA